ncbi:hypothetical protein DACRYDRAFT_108899 [Dacryopinax primogenitus]|uniref:Uncharacterized protein n=1 Tax=Dacryopinax primogenitus (strain DJM 731) TaxID=1858805 RepID=M5FTA6_DACPD|nr:uncharacterized protein DACRYDRAFT_108899 [Dacryopinax primogenitus]EJU00846.1 hypothetical protein DACRYDRAFT_108899 [Dacryopinax primogenitus]
MSTSQRQRSALDLRNRVQFGMATEGLTLEHACMDLSTSLQNSVNIRASSGVSASPDVPDVSDTLLIEPIIPLDLKEVAQFLACFGFLRLYCNGAFIMRRGSG